MPSSSPLSQFVHSVEAFSSQYGNRKWSAKCVIGPPSVYPTHADDPRAWAPKKYHHMEYIEVTFQTAVFPLELQVYETYIPGSIVKISMRASLNDPWTEVYQNARDEVAAMQDVSRIWRVPFGGSDQKFKHVRLDMDNTMSTSGFVWPSWSELDAICLIGTTSKQIRRTEIQDAYLELFEKALYADIVFFFPDGKGAKSEIVKAHRGLLASRSVYFAKMFSSGMKESELQRVDITDVSIRLFRHMLEYLYSFDAQVLNEDIIPLNKCADRYGVEDLKVLCREKLEKALNVDNSVDFLKQAIELKQSALEQDIIRFLSRNYEAFFGSDTFGEIDEKSLRKVCKCIGDDSAQS
uniref:BTB domain-containing protein n=1 Tax=Percolomonas cosmopolitus TaxID=63605 RepID=A0A7S1PGP3_9EUKA